MDVTGGAATAATTSNDSCGEPQVPREGYSLDIFGCKLHRYSLRLIERCKGDPFKAWAILQEKYCATDAEENYPELDRAFSDCKLDGTKKDPELWFNDLDHLNMRLCENQLEV
ncbi:hypothetical protein MHU86_22566 [Fragilaria crotonensis]|nr:hypothetical protein MHU86_22566 [Fragilaria crotonensis]